MEDRCKIRRVAPKRILLRMKKHLKNNNKFNSVCKLNKYLFLFVLKCLSRLDNICRSHWTSLSAPWIWPKDAPKARHQTSRVLMSNTVGLSSGSRSTMSSRGRNLCRLTCGSRLDLSKEISSQDKKEILVLNPLAVTMTFISLPHNSLHSVPDALC